MNETGEKVSRARSKWKPETLWHRHCRRLWGKICVHFMRDNLTIRGERKTSLKMVMACQRRIMYERDINHRCPKKEKYGKYSIFTYDIREARAWRLLSVYFWQSQIIVSRTFCNNVSLMSSTYSDGERRTVALCEKGEIGIWKMFEKSSCHIHLTQQSSGYVCWLLLSFASYSRHNNSARDIVMNGSDEIGNYCWSFLSSTSRAHLCKLTRVCVSTTWKR